jgi:hypothetical protein
MTSVLTILGLTAAAASQGLDSTTNPSSDPLPAIVQPSPSFDVHWEPQQLAFQATAIDRRISKAQQIKILQADLERCTAMYQESLLARQNSEMHANMLRVEHQRLKGRLNAQEAEKARKPERLRTGGIFITSIGAQVGYDRQREKEVEKDNERQQKADEKVAVESSARERRLGIYNGVEVVRFTGSLKSKRKPELQDILFVIDPTSSLNTTCEDLRTRIMQELTARRRTLEKDDRVAGLYASIDLTTGRAKRGEILAQATATSSGSAVTNLQHPAPPNFVHPVTEDGYSQVQHANLPQAGLELYEPSRFLLSPSHSTPSRRRVLYAAVNGKEPAFFPSNIEPWSPSRRRLHTSSY